MAIKLNGPSLYQWDARRTVTVDETVTEVHFAISGDEQALVVVPDGGICDIPNQLLQRVRYLDVWTFFDEKTIETVRFTITPRAKPMDYIYEPTHIQTIEELTKEVKAAIAESQKATQAALDTAEDLLERAANGEFDGPQGIKGDGYAKAEVTVDGNVGVPSVAVSESGAPDAKTLSIDFKNLRGAGIVGATATVDDKVGTPSVEVTATGEEHSKTLNFAFKNMKGETGDLLAPGEVLPIANGGTGQSDARNAVSALFPKQFMEPKDAWALMGVSWQFGETGYLTPNVIRGMMGLGNTNTTLGIEFGGTGAVNIDAARGNFGIGKLLWNGHLNEGGVATINDDALGTYDIIGIRVQLPDRGTNGTFMALMRRDDTGHQGFVCAYGNAEDRAAMVSIRLGFNAVENPGKFKLNVCKCYMLADNGDRQPITYTGAIPIPVVEIWGVA